MTALEDLRPERLSALDEVCDAAEGAAGGASEGAAGGASEGAAGGAAEGAAGGAAEGAAGGAAEGAAGGALGTGSGVPGCRVRFALGVSELPGDRAVVVLHDDAILRWRPTPKRPDGALSRLSEVAVGAAIAVEHHGIWDEGLVLGRVVRPACDGGFRVDGDVERYRSIAEAEGAHGPLEAGEPEAPPARTGEPVFELGEPIGRDARGIGRRARR
ncbi:hypothetical protein [Sorangium sp. So ce1000]|uniref:hypothetical protein n=1 Tax=Sorangium sp. So ce1000 TaxID=3133325 RepID=UPI003F605B75